MQLGLDKGIMRICASVISTLTPPSCQHSRGHTCNLFSGGSSKEMRARYAESFQQEDAMKTTTLLFVGAFLMAAVVSEAGSQGITRDEGPVRIFAQLSSYQKADMQYLEKFFLGSLNYPHDAVIESAIGEITRLKIAQQSCCSQAIESKLLELAREGNTSAIRYKATLASILFDNPNLFAEDAFRDFANPEELFRAMSRRLEKEVLVLNVR